MRYFVRFSYRGTDYHGSQTQPNGITVQETMEKAFSLILRTPVALTFAGRTDAGVHAREMWAHFDTSSPADAKWVMRLNSLLPADIAVYDIVPVVDEAHARFSATARSYEYHVTTRKSPFLTDLAARVAPGLDYQAMNRAAQLLYGRHDFASFCRVHTDVKTTFCTITRAEWEVLPTPAGSTAASEAVFHITADRFLRNMVRAVVGTLFDVGRGKISVDDFQRIIDQKNRCSAGQSAPASGLFLTRVDYPSPLFL